jgi:hypothetical protein
MDALSTVTEKRSADHVSRRMACAPFGRKGTARGRRSEQEDGVSSFATLAF